MGAYMGPCVDVWMHLLLRAVFRLQSVLPSERDRHSSEHQDDDCTRLEVWLV
jgi:hypothetical protein